MERDINHWGVGKLPGAIASRGRTCAFTGPRPKKLPWRYDESAPACLLLKSTLAEQIKELADKGVEHFLSGGAEGVDLYAAEAVLALRESNPAVKLYCVLPYRGQADRWPDTSKKQYCAVLERADVIAYVSQTYHKDCMLERNRFMADFASVLLAVYNGEQRGGTAATVRYARRRGRELFIIDPISCAVAHEEAKEIK